VDNHERQQPDARRPKNLRGRLKEMTVAIDRFWAEEDLQVSDQVTDYKNEKPGTRESHQKLLPERGRKEPQHNVHGCSYGVIKMRRRMPEVSSTTRSG